MLSKPDIPDETIIACLESDFGLRVESLEFLPLGADSNTAVYRAAAPDSRSYFVKLRGGRFLEASVTVPHFLHEIGIRQVIPPIRTSDGRLWANLPSYSVILSPYIEGTDGFETPLTDPQRVEFGRILRLLHATSFPDGALRDVPEETFSTRWQESVREFMKLASKENFEEEVAAETAFFLHAQSDALSRLLDHTAALTRRARAQGSPRILCHADIHVGNLHLAADGAVYIIDWDTLRFAPVERDLMFIGAGLGGAGHSPEEEVRFFFEGYGPIPVDQDLVGFYRCDRILEDIAVYCEELLLTTEGGADRPRNLQYLKSNFDPGGTIDRAYGRS